MLDLRPRSCGSKLALCPRARRIDLCSVQDQHRMTRPGIADFFYLDVKNQITHTQKSNNNNYDLTGLNLFVLILYITVDNFYSHVWTISPSSRLEPVHTKVSKK